MIKNVAVRWLTHVEQKEGTLLNNILLQTKKTGAEVFGELCWRRMEKIKWSQKVNNEQVLQLIGEDTSK